YVQYSRPRSPRATPVPYTTLFRSESEGVWGQAPTTKWRASPHERTREKHGQGSEEAEDEREARLAQQESKPRSQARYGPWETELDRKSTRLNSSHVAISYAVFCLK